MIKYDEIIEGLSDERVKGLLDRLEIPYVDKGEYLVMPTVCHNADLEEASQKLYYYKNSHLFMCYTSCGGQSIFRFLQHYYKARDIDYDWFDDIYNLILDCSSFTETAVDGFRKVKYVPLGERYGGKRKEKQLPEYPSGALGCFTKTYPVEWLSDGISKKAIDKFNILFSISQNKIIIPHYDAAGRLVGIRGRALNEWEVDNVGKYAPVCIENTWYSHPLSMNLYGLNFNKENIQRSGICYVVESEKAVMQAESFSTPNCCVAICGSNFNKYALNIILKECYPREIVLCLDNEELPGEENYFNKLYRICDKYKNYTNFSFIYDREKITALKDSPTDKGEEVFKELLHRRVRVR